MNEVELRWLKRTRGTHYAKTTEKVLQYRQKTGPAVVARRPKKGESAPPDEKQAEQIWSEWKDVQEVEA